MTKVADVFIQLNVSPVIEIKRLRKTLEYFT